MPQTSNHLNNKNKKEGTSRFESLINDSKRCVSSPSSLSSPPGIEQTTLVISISEQKLYVFKNQEVINSYTISSAEAGPGNLSGSFQTPLGAHQISEKIGQNSLSGTIFKARKDTHTIAKILTNPNTKSTEDNITSRILWLDGLENEINKGTNNEESIIDTHSRYIYIHGTDEEGRLGQAVSHGCIRMANQEIIELFDIVKIGCLVLITED